MAGRSGIGPGLGSLIGVLGVASLGLFVTTVVFWSKASKSQRELQSATADTASFISSSERAQDEFQRLKDLASKADGKPSVAKFLNDSLKTTMQRVTGVPNDGVDQLKTKFDDVPSGTSLLESIRGMRSEIGQLNDQLDSAKRAQTRAEENAKIEIDRVKQIESANAKTVAELNQRIDAYKADIDKYQAELAEARKLMDGRVTKAEDDFAAKEKDLRDRNAQLARDNLRLNEQVAALRGQAKESLIKPGDEASLVDGQILDVNQGESEVFISRGTKDKVFLGMTFAVYADANALRPDPQTGELPAPKATIEITNVGVDSSTARIRPGSERRGNPVVKGDIVVNPVYDPKKVYRFVVFGNFDPKGLGHPTEAGAAEIEAMITNWGGQVAAELMGDVDFLVMGQRPVLPSAPRPGSPIAVVQEYNRQYAKAQRYDDLIKQAQATSLPVLNANRLFTLIGR